jgi:hypothetical protein
MTTDLLEGFAQEAELARQPGMPTQRTLRNYRKRPDGPAYMEWRGRIYIDLNDFKARFLPSLVRRPNPRRGRAA